MSTPVLCVLSLAAVAAMLFCVVLNRAMLRTPAGALMHVAEPLTAEAARAAYSRVVSGGVDSRKYHPPRLDRRYIIVGGSGLVGCQIALDLVAGGTPPEAIRLIDVRAPFRQEFSTSGVAGSVPFVQADITSEASTAEAFGKPWPVSVAQLPLTVFHTAAVIRPYERHEAFYSRCSRVNVLGAANSLSSAQRGGAGVFIYTSSSHVAASDVSWFSSPLGGGPRNFTQFLTEKDFDEPLREANEFPSNYARSKAEAERLVCGANGDGFKTGCIRPGNAIYGHMDDAVVGRIIRIKRAPTYSAPWVQSWVSVRNVSLAHLLLEREILGAHGEKIAGRPFLVTDDGPAVRFQDVYTLLGTTSRTGLKIDHPPPVLMLLLAYAIEWYCVVLAKWPVLGRVLRVKEPGEPVVLFQPGTMASTVTQIVRDDQARRKPEDGGIGYRGYCGTVEGMCAQIIEWNRMGEEE